MAGTTAVCAVHGKSRGLKYLIPTPDGQYSCSPDNECKGGPGGGGSGLSSAMAGAMGLPADGKVACSDHGRQRTIENMEEVSPGSGMYRCIATSRCKTGGIMSADVAGTAGSAASWAASGPAVCAAHGKKRSMDSLEESPPGSGVFTCTAAGRCKTGAAGAAATPQPSYAAAAGFPGYPAAAGYPGFPAAAGYPGFPGYPGAAAAAAPKMALKGTPEGKAVVMCADHQKNRTMDNMEETGPGSGEYRCTGLSRCKTGGPGENAGMPGGVLPEGPAICATHGKKRSPDCLQESAPGSGVFVCTPAMRCKTGAGADAASPAAAGARYSPYGASPAGAWPGAAAMYGYPPPQAYPGYPPAAAYGYPPAAAAPRPAADPSANPVCATHGKKRSMTCLQPNPDGTYSCTAANMCK